MFRSMITALLFLPLFLGFNSAAAPPTLAGETETEDVKYRNGKVELAGTIYFPDGEAPFPGVVVLQGSGTSGRSNVWSQRAAALLRGMGLAVLLTDKRGVGESGGDWRTASFGDLAGDALAGVETLRAHPSVSPDNVGVIGLSQGGRVAPLAAARGNADFVINFVGGAVPAKAGLFHELEQTYRQHGLSGDDIAFLQEMTRLSFVYIETGEGFEDYLAHRRKVRERYGEMGVATWPDSPNNWYWAFWRQNYDYDPVPHWKTVTEDKAVPAFIAYGEEDEYDNVPVADSVRRLEQNVESPLLAVHVYPGVGHSLMVHRNGEMAFTPPLVEDLRRWLRDNALRSSP